MPTRSHTKNIAYFRELIAACQAFGPAYNPPSPDLSISSLQSLLQTSENALQQLGTARVQYNNAIHARQTDFLLLRSLATRLINAMSAEGIPAHQLRTARSLVRKIQNDHNKRKTKTAKIRAVSQQAFSTLAQNFQLLVTAAATQPLYDTNIPDLKIPALQSASERFISHNTQVAQAKALYRQAIFLRNEKLYAPNTGLIFVAGRTKMYIRSVFGTPVQNLRW